MHRERRRVAGRTRTFAARSVRTRATLRRPLRVGAIAVFAERAAQLLRGLVGDALVFAALALGQRFELAAQARARRFLRVALLAKLGAYYGEGRNWRYVLFNRHGGSSATGTSSRTAALLALKDAGAEAIYVDNGDAYELEWSHR